MGRAAASRLQHTSAGQPSELADLASGIVGMGITPPRPWLHAYCSALQSVMSGLVQSAASTVAADAWQRPQPQQAGLDGRRRAGRVGGRGRGAVIRKGWDLHRQPLRAADLVLAVEALARMLNARPSPHPHPHRHAAMPSSPAGLSTASEGRRRRSAGEPCQQASSPPPPPRPLPSPAAHPLLPPGFAAWFFDATGALAKAQTQAAWLLPHAAMRPAGMQAQASSSGRTDAERATFFSLPDIASLLESAVHMRMQPPPAWMESMAGLAVLLCSPPPSMQGAAVAATASSGGSSPLAVAHLLPAALQ